MSHEVTLHIGYLGFPRNLIEDALSEIKFTGRESALKQDNKTQKDILRFVTQYRPSVPNIKQALMKKMAHYTKSTTAPRNIQRATNGIL